MGSVISCLFECVTKVICGPIVVISSQVAQSCHLQFFDAVVIFASHPDVCPELALQPAIDRLELRVAGAFEPIELADLASEHDELLLDGRN